MPFSFVKRRAKEGLAKEAKPATSSTSSSRLSALAKRLRKKDPAESDSNEVECPFTAKSTCDLPQIERDLATVPSETETEGVASLGSDPQAGADKAALQGLIEPEWRACVFDVGDYFIGECELALLPGVYSTRAGHVGRGEGDAVQVLYDVSVTCPRLLSQAAGHSVVDSVGDSQVFHVAPPEHQKHHLQESGLAVALTEPEDGGKVFSSKQFASRLNAYCLGFGSAPELEKDCKYLTSRDRKSLQAVWKAAKGKPLPVYAPECPTPRYTPPAGQVIATLLSGRENADTDAECELPLRTPRSQRAPLSARALPTPRPNNPEF